MLGSWHKTPLAISQILSVSVFLNCREWTSLMQEVLILLSVIAVFLAQTLQKQKSSTANSPECEALLWLAVLWVLIVVIGRGGEQINRIQLESGCKIQIAAGEIIDSGLQPGPARPIISQVVRPTDPDSRDSFRGRSCEFVTLLTADLGRAAANSDWRRGSRKF